MESQHESKTKLLDAALHVIRAKGYSAARIEDICAEGGLTKGSFFHHFESKEALALAAVDHWRAVTGAGFATAPYRSLPDPVERLLAYVDHRKALLRGDLPDFTCLVGTMVQEAYDTHPRIREACAQSIQEHAATLEADIAEAMTKHGMAKHGMAQQGLAGTFTPRSLALYTQTVVQGAFVLAKAQHGAQVAADALDHLRRYLALLFNHPSAKETP